jgi:predicted NUDIX family phosphoesterase
MSEKVLVVTKEFLQPHLQSFRGGFCKDPGVVSDVVSGFASGSFVERGLAEKNPAYKQVIPYCVLFAGRELFRYKRSPKGGERRLHSRWSLGVGGHINPADGSAGNVYEAGLWRELKEEVGLTRDGVLSNEVAGLIYDPSDEVGLVHLGVVHLLRVKPGVPLVCEDEALLQGYFEHATQVPDTADQFESWSRLVIKNLLS